MHSVVILYASCSKAECACRIGNKEIERFQKFPKKFEKSCKKRLTFIMIICYDRQADFAKGTAPDCCSVYAD